MRATPLATAVSCLLAGHLLLGVAHVAILPPWEGFDETAHYSYLQQLADRGELPRLGTARMSTDVSDALTRLTVLAYPTLAASAWVAGGLLVLMGLASAWKASRALEDPARCA